MFEGFDWQPILIGAIAVMSLINGFSVFQNYRSDRAVVKVEPVYEEDWMYWTELVDEKSSETVRRYIVIGHLARTNFGRRPTSIANTNLRIRLRNMRTARSALYNIPPPELAISNAESQRLPVMKAGPDPFDFRPMIQPGQSAAGIHCFLFGMYGSDLWMPKTENGVLEGTVELESGFGNTFKSKVNFRQVDFKSLVKLFPTLEAFVMKNLEGDEA
jgi:hypothetical protein